MAVDWLKIKTEYINDPNTSYRKLSQKYGVSANSICKKSKEENWKEKRKQKLDSTCTAVVQKTVKKTSEALSDEAAAKVRIRAKIYLELESRLNGAEVGSADFRRLVQSYKDMCEIQDESKQGANDKVMVVIDV